MSKSSQGNEIIESYVNGQFKQMVSQIDEFGVYDFVSYLERLGLSSDQKFDILKVYLRIKNN